MKTIALLGVFFLTVASSSSAMGEDPRILNVNGSYAVPEQGETYDSVVFANGGTLTGGMLTLVNGGDGIKVNGGTATINCPVMMDDGDSRIPIEVAAGASLKANGVISGAGDILVHGAGATHFAGANDFTGDLRITNGQFYAENDLAFGSTEGHTSYIVGNALRGSAASDTAHMQMHFVGITTSEIFDRLDGANYNSWYFTGINRFNGNIVKSGGTLARCNSSGAQVHFGAVANLDVGVIPSGGTWYFDPASTVKIAQINMGGTEVHFQSRVGVAQVDYQGGIGVKSPNATYYFEVDDAVYNSQANAGVGGHQAVYLFQSGTFYLGTTHQHFRSIFSMDGTASLITGETGSKVTVYQVPFAERVTHPYDSKANPDFMGFCGGFGGSVSLVVDGTYKDESYYRPFVFVSGNNSSTGDLVVTNGAEVCFSNTTHWAGKRIYVGPDSSLKVENSSALMNDAELHMSSSARLVFPIGSSALSVTVGRLFVDGIEQPAQHYGTQSTAIQVEGNGELLVTGNSQGATGVWQGEGADDNFTTAGNWEGGQVVEHGLGNSEVLVAGGASMRLNEAVRLNKLTVSSRPDGFTIDGDSSLTLGSGGIVLSDKNVTEDEQPVTMLAPLTCKVPQSWEVPEHRRLDLAGAVTSAGSVDLVKNGYGELRLSGVNDFSGTLKISQGTARFIGGASAGGENVLVQGLNETGIAKTWMRFAGGTFPQRFELSGGLMGAHLPESRLLYSEPNTTNIFLQTVANNSGLRPEFGEGSYMEFRQGMTGTQGFIVGSGARDATVVFAGKPSYFTLVGLSGPGSGYTTYDFTVASNVFSSTYLMITYNARVNLRARHAVCRDKNNVPLVMGSASMQTPILDLCGNDQEFQLGDWASSGPTGSRTYWSYAAEVTSERAATIDLKQEKADIDWHGFFSGGVSILKSGSCRVTFVNGLNKSSSTTGTVTVAEGSLVFDDTARWPNVSALAATGGEMCIGTNAVINSAAKLSLSGSGVVRLEGTDTRLFSELWVDGRLAPGGVYSSVDGPAGADKRFAAHFAGTGAVRVRRRTFTISIR